MTILQQAHQQTVLWLGQRDTCLSCKRCLTRIGTQGETILHCTQVTAIGMRHGAYCIDARAGQCGPDAKLFQPKEQP